MSGPHGTPFIALAYAPSIRSSTAHLFIRLPAPLPAGRRYVCGSDLRSHPPAQGWRGTSFIIAELYGDDHPDEWDFGIRKR